MNVNRNVIWSLAIIFLASVLVLANCSPNQVNASNIVDDANEAGVQNGSSISSPESARDTVLTHLRIDNTAIPGPNINWQEKDITSAEAVAMNNYLYSYQDWTVSVVSPQVEPESRVFTVIVLNENEQYKWAGLVDANGTIVQMGLLQPATPLPTSTPILLTTRVPTITPSFFTATPIPVPCNDVSFLEDVTVPDGTTFLPGQQFLKEWRLRNVGSCTWTTDYDLIFVGGNRLGAELAIPLAETVLPGESVDLGAYMVAPQIPGTYRGFWMLRNANGIRFGVGEDANDSFWVEIQVEQGNLNLHKYDFAPNFCAAIWRTAAGRIPCGDISTPQDGTVRYLISPAFENRHENEPTIQVHPNEDRDGWIEGTFPAITLENGDHFRGWVGCMAGYEFCNVTFYLAYIGEDNRTYTLGTWREIYDNQVTVIDIDLSNLAGQSVQFILGMEANTANITSAQGFWFVPRIAK